jgi:hypothetical protein
MPTIHAGFGKASKGRLAVAPTLRANAKCGTHIASTTIIHSTNSAPETVDVTT